jgi:hypothetical protein
MTDRARPRRDTAQDLTRSVVDLIRAVGGGGAARTPVTGTTGSSGGLLGTTTGASVAAGRIASTAALPAAGAKLWRAVRVLEGGSGVADTVWVCLETATDGTYAWVQIA